MTRILFLLLALGLVSACGEGNPFDEPEEEATDTGGGESGGGDTGGIESDRNLPPGTESPTPDKKITRYEADDGDGGGYVRNVQYINDNGEDLFIVDNLAFDGDNGYSRGDPISALGPASEFAVYEADAFATDPVTGNVVETQPYRAVYGKSASGQTEFAIVRTGGYQNYGFGGFIYQRNTTDLAGDPVSLILPTEGDAAYSGGYGGVRIFNGRGGLEYTQGTATMKVDFKDFNDNQRGVALYVRDRRLFDQAGNDITDAYLTALDTVNESKTRVSDGDLPDILPIITPEIADANGEVVGDVYSLLSYTDGTSEELANGTYYAIMSGANVDEIVGVVVIEEDDPRTDGVTVQETGGFIVYRQ